MVTRRSFLTGTLASTIAAGCSAAALLELLGLRAAAAAIGDGLRFGALEPLAALMQELAPNALLVELTRRVRAGESLETFVAAGALANARTFGGEDYDGYHAFMALMPSLAMARRLTDTDSALPVLKVLHRSSARIQTHGGRAHDVLAHDIAAATATNTADDALRTMVRAHELDRAESALKAISTLGRDAALRALAPVVRDATDVHRVVLAWRAFETSSVTGEDDACALLRQVVHYCAAAEKQSASASELRDLTPKLVRDHGLATRTLGRDPASVETLRALADVCCNGSRIAAATAMAAALARGVDPEHCGEALSLAATSLLLADQGVATQPTAEKPLGSVHGASIGVHASDAAHAWRNLARALPESAAETLIVAAYHTAGQSALLGQRFAFDEQLGEVATTPPAALLARLDAAIGGADQRRACAVATRYLATGGDSEALIARLLAFALADDGALHAEKYFVTATDVFRMGRPPLRDAHLVALARVCASQHVKAAQSVIDARELFSAG